MNTKKQSEDSVLFLVHSIMTIIEGTYEGFLHEWNPVLFFVYPIAFAFLIAGIVKLIKLRKENQFGCTKGGIIFAVVTSIAFPIIMVLIAKGIPEAITFHFGLLLTRLPIGTSVESDETALKAKEA